MKILFLCGSLEPGRDGVGDYTRRLAGEIMRQGHDAIIIALNDRYIGGSTLDNGSGFTETAGLTGDLKALESLWDTDFRVRCCTHDADGTPVPAIRIEPNFPWRRRERMIEDVTKVFAPDWVSLQFVPYSFHSKGLPFQLLWMLGKLRKTIPVKWHVMFHELWIGYNPQRPFFSKLVAALQQLCVKWLHDFDIASTHLPVYMNSLRELHFDPQPLPLFGNIPVNSNKVPKPLPADTKTINIGFFSQQAGNDKVLEWLQEFIRDAGHQGYMTRIHFAGRLADQDRVFWEKGLQAIAEIIVHDWMPAEEISPYLQTLDIGITTMPCHALGKSSSVVAFIEHGLVFAAPNRISDYINVRTMPNSLSQQVFFDMPVQPQILANPQLSTVLTAWSSNRIMMSLLPTIGKQFINELKK